MQHPTIHETDSASAQEVDLKPDLPPRPIDVAPPRRPRGFAAIDRARVQQIARMGGKAAHAAGTAHEFTSDEARIAGRKGGQATQAKRKELVEEPVEAAK
jgi:general stress protein YciG